MTTAGHAIVVKRSLPVVKGSAMDLAYYSNLLSVGVMAPAVLVAESGHVAEMFNIGGQGLRTFVVGGLITGFFGFLICIAGFISIKVTSPITHMISAAVRGVIQTILGVWLFGDIVTKGRISSIAIVLMGSIFYTWFKDQEMKAAESSRGGSIPMQPTSINVEDEEADALVAADELIRDSELEENRRREADRELSTSKD